MRRLVIAVLLAGAAVAGWQVWPSASGPGISPPTLSRAGGNATQASLPTGVVSSQGEPVHISLPNISGIPMPSASGITGAGSLTVTNGSWSNSPTSYTYQWQDCDATGANCTNATGTGATTNSYTVAPADTGSSIRVRVTAHNSSGTGVADAYTGPAPALWYEGGYSGGNTSAGELRDANLFRMINLNPAYTDLVDAYHADNPKAIIIEYNEGISSIQDAANGDPCADAAASWTQASAHPGNPQYDWFLYNKNGFGSGNRLVHDQAGHTEYAMDVRNTYWQQDCATYIIKRGQSHHLARGVDGFFIDDVNLAMNGLDWFPTQYSNAGFPIVAATGNYTNNDQFNVGLMSEMAALTARFHAAGYIGIANTAYNGFAPAAREAIASASDGTMEEGFSWPDSGQDSQVLFKIGEGVYNEAHGKWFIAVADTHGAPTEAALTYSLANFLMEANGHSVFDLQNVVGSGAAATWYPEFTTAMQLGPALGAYYSRSVGGYTIYERDFTNGVALVNPSHNSIPAFAPESGGHTYSGSGYTHASTVTLGADQGLVLLRTG